MRKLLFLLTGLGIALMVQISPAIVVQGWEARYLVPGNAYNNPVFDLAVDGYTNVYVTGMILEGGGDAYDFCTIKYDSSGVQQWVATYNGSGYSSDCPVALAVDATGCVYVAGFSFHNSSEIDYVTIKYDIRNSTMGGDL